MIRPFLLSLLLAMPAQAQGADPVALATAETRAWCEGQGGTLALGEAPLTLVDLTGDGTADDAIVSEEGAFCGPDLGFLGGSGGFMIHAVVGQTVQSWQAGAWLLTDLVFIAEGEAQPPLRTLILALHGSACDAYGAAPCTLSLAWDGTRLISVADAQPAPDEN